MPELEHLEQRIAGTNHIVSFQLGLCPWDIHDARKSKVAIFEYGFGPENGEDIQKISILNRENNPTS